MVTERFRFEGAAFGGPPYQRPRWKDCVAATERALGATVGEAFARRTAPADRRERAAHVAADLTRSLEAELRVLPWMDDPTRARAREKLARLTVRTGGPDGGREDGLHAMHDSYFRNVLSAGRSELRRRLDQIGRSPDRDWPLPASAPAVAYDPVQDALFLPAGVLQAPFFEVDAPEELRYGAGGTVAGAALVGLLDAGAVQRDADGAGDWWSPRTGQQFDAVGACLAGQVGDGVAAEAGLEALADRGGLRLAWSALLSARAARPPTAAARKVHGLTPDQQFFVAYAQARCATHREDARAEGRPMRARVNGAVASAPAFAAAFSCKDGAPMVRPRSAGCGEW